MVNAHQAAQDAETAKREADRQKREAEILAAAQQRITDARNRMTLEVGNVTTLLAEIDAGTKLAKNDSERLAWAVQRQQVETQYAEVLAHEKDSMVDIIKQLSAISPQQKAIEAPQIIPGELPSLGQQGVEVPKAKTLKDTMSEQKVAAEEWAKEFPLLAKAASGTLSGISGVLASDTRNWITGVQTFGDAFAKVWIDLAAVVIEQIEKMLVEYALLAIAQAVVGAATGGAGVVVTEGINFGRGHEGGVFEGTPTGVKKMAEGGTFTVPPGFKNDTFPLMVESGEEVTVVPEREARERKIRSISMAAADRSPVMSSYGQSSSVSSAMNPSRSFSDTGSHYMASVTNAATQGFGGRSDQMNALIAAVKSIPMGLTAKIRGNDIILVSEKARPAYNAGRFGVVIAK